MLLIMQHKAKNGACVFIKMQVYSSVLLLMY